MANDGLRYFVAGLFLLGSLSLWIEASCQASDDRRQDCLLQCVAASETPEIVAVCVCGCTNGGGDPPCR